MAWAANTGLPAYSDSVGTANKCHSRRNVTVTGIFCIKRSFFGPKKCHSNRNVAVTGVTVSGEACTENDVDVCHLQPDMRNSRNSGMTT